MTFYRMQKDLLAVIAATVLIASPLAANTPSASGESAAVEERSSTAEDTARAPSVVAEEEAAEKERAQSSTQRFDVQFRLGVLNDDNVLNLRDEAIDEFELTGGASDRFRIRSIDDTVYTPEIRLVFSTRPANRKTFRVAAGAKGYRHEENEIRDYERYRFYIQKDLTDTREDLARLQLSEEDLPPVVFQTRRRFLLSNRSRLQLGYYNIVKRYVGERIDDDAVEQTDIRVPIRKSSIYDADGLEARYQQRLTRGERNRLRLDLRYRHEERDYNAEFDERDSDRDRYSIGLNNFHLKRRYFTQLGVAYEFTEVESNTALIGKSNAVGSSIQDDLSSERDALRLLLGFYWFDQRGNAPFRKNSEFEIGVSLGSRDYITDNALDRSHFGRSDDYLQVILDYGRPISDGVTIEVFGQWASVSSDFSELAATSRQIEDYDEVVFGLAFNFYTGWRSR